MLIAFVTHAGLPGLSADDRLAVEELHRRGARVEPAIWDDPGVRWSAYDRVVIRSSWDYHLRPDAFLGWLDRLEAEEIPLWNPAPVVRGNVDKGYLADLAAAGLPVVPTVRLERGEAVDLAALLDRQGWTEVVVKPSVSASAFRTLRAGREEAGAAQAKLEELLASSGALVQPFLPEIQTGGEWSLIFLGGKFSHAVLKKPKEGDFRVQQELGGSADPAVPPPDLVEQARRVTERIPGPWLYARVDGLEIGGTFTLMELELTEPSLFLAADEQAPARFAEAILGED
jgi:glutathione synthase/RimK-type ligase-like ATP-grasp enzyme